jgi:hypothetical protein
VKHADVVPGVMIIGVSFQHGVERPLRVGEQPLAKQLDRLFDRIPARVLVAHR